MSEGPSDRWAHRAHLDGLRAVAVYLVVAFHAGSAQLAGGFIGVDVFFVLSGYLVTSLLVRDLEGDGRIRYGRFYARRVRRLLPAALVTLVATAAVYGSIGNPLQLDDAAEDIRAAALYVANWHFIARSTDYFADDITASPVLHFWSLSIEEQFYLAWPLAFGAVWRLGRRARRWSHRVVQATLGSLALLSAGAAVALVGASPDRAYFGTDTRAYQLLAGALLAVSPGVPRAVAGLAGRSSRARWLAPIGAVAGLGAIGLLATSVVGTDPVRRGLLTTVATLALLVALEASSRGPVQRVLSWRPVAYLGQISYGTYLWHWLVILAIGQHVRISALATAAVAGAVATGLASLSHQLLESPIRTSARLDPLRRPVIATGLALSLLVGLVVAPRVLDRSDGLDADLAAPTAGATVTVDPDLVVDARDDNFDYDECPSSSGRLCVLAEGDGATAVLVGDSHAGVWAAALVELAERHDLTLLAGLLSYCPWQRGIRYPMAGPNCLEDQAELYDELLPAADPDLVFLASRAGNDLNAPSPLADADAGLLEDAARDEVLARRADQTVGDLVADGRRVVVFEPLPIAPRSFNPLRCLARELDPTACRFVASATPTAEDTALRALPERYDAVTTIDADTLSCPYLPICDPVVDGRIVRRDGDHLTSSYARSIADPIDAFLVALGVLAA